MSVFPSEVTAMPCDSLPPTKNGASRRGEIGELDAVDLLVGRKIHHGESVEAGKLREYPFG